MATREFQKLPRFLHKIIKSIQPDFTPRQKAPETTNKSPETTRIKLHPALALLPANPARINFSPRQPPCAPRSESVASERKRHSSGRGGGCIRGAAAHLSLSVYLGAFRLTDRAVVLVHASVCLSLLKKRREKRTLPSLVRRGVFRRLCKKEKKKEEETPATRWCLPEVLGALSE